MYISTLPLLKLPHFQENFFMRKQHSAELEIKWKISEQTENSVTNLPSVLIKNER